MIEKYECNNGNITERMNVGNTLLITEALVNKRNVYFGSWDLL
jgi:hypothetical protein